eukprot:CAMPEP_0172491588 /NCGR_PEP_ID=MMETSP1066-20121228/22449_1 /TAXON_ID=671091 /ORGANISM="Coscinodiscus wailesii, Strain CCMP2513" /LENGTH=363 /DNA_ID=CAMNT_0013260715 /DNA_START=229 /DNA_END=1320 /DNA_ORIENTATION=-
MVKSTHKALFNRTDSDYADHNALKPNFDNGFSEDKGLAHQTNDIELGVACSRLNIVVNGNETETVRSDVFNQAQSTHTADFPTHGYMAPKSEKMNKVCFSTVTIREYDTILGDHPNCTSGPSLSIDWTYDAYNVQVVNIDDYENNCVPPFNDSDIYIPADERVELLLNRGYTREQVEVAIAERHEYLNQRRRRNDSKVCFSTVEIREYETILGDHPFVSSGPALSIGWSYNKDNVQSFTLDEYEGRKEVSYGYDIIIPCHERIQRLISNGYTHEQIRNPSLTFDKDFQNEIKNKPASPIFNYIWHTSFETKIDDAIAQLYSLWKPHKTTCQEEYRDINICEQRQQPDPGMKHFYSPVITTIQG